MLGGVTEVKSTGWRIGDLEFRPDTGELRPVGGGANGEYERLAPQPAQLLELLASRGGELVTREEARDLLWPDTHVDLDQSLSFCIRQIRAALGDSASRPRWIETLPRRGYRLLCEAAPLESEVGTVLRPGARARAATVVALLAVAAVAGWWAARPTASRVRLAIMPFELAAPDGALTDALAGVSETVLAELVEGGGLAVVGPRSTREYEGSPFPDLDRLAAELDVDYVLNARFLDAERNALLLVELIRLSDRAHPWAHRYAPPWRWRETAEEISSRVSAAIAADRR